MERFKLWDVAPLTDESVSPKQEPELLYFPCEGAKSCVIVFPGGGYITLCDSYEGVELAEWLNTVGVAAFVLRYRVLPYHYPCQLADAHRAIRFVRHNAEHFGIDKDKIGAMGFSAGGNLVAQAATLEHTPLENVNDPRVQNSMRRFCATPFRHFRTLHTQRQWKTFSETSERNRLTLFRPIKTFRKSSPRPHLYGTRLPTKRLMCAMRLSTLPRAKKKTCRLNCTFFRMGNTDSVLRRSSRTLRDNGPN